MPMLCQEGMFGSPARELMVSSRVEDVGKQGRHNVPTLHRDQSGVRAVISKTISHELLRLIVKDLDSLSHMRRLITTTSIKNAFQNHVVTNHLSPSRTLNLSVLNQFKPIKQQIRIPLRRLITPRNRKCQIRCIRILSIRKRNDVFRVLGAVWSTQLTFTARASGDLT
jgi:hypothetical protein